MYEIVSLRPPFMAKNHISLARNILKGEFERIPSRYSEDLQYAISLML